VTVQSVPIDAGFHHSSGVLGTHFFKALKDDKRLLGWKTGSRVIVPPRDYGGNGEWVEVGPGAKLEAYSPPEWSAVGSSDGAVLALVKPDGADTAMLARLQLKGATPAAGARLTIKFAAERRGEITDFWFECA
jgi:uncharacterized OB-fold protein